MKNANLVSSFLCVLAMAAGLWVAPGCARSDGPMAPAAMATPQAVDTWFTIAVGGQVVRMQVAVTPAEQEHGLMGRRDLKPAEGMIFVFAKPQQQTFWMRNTPTPLDVGYFGTDGVLAEVYPMYPFDETPVPSRSDAVNFALEMNQGWFAAHGVKPGAQLDLKALAAALRARGFDPAGYVKGE